MGVVGVWRCVDQGGVFGSNGPQFKPGQKYETHKYLDVATQVSLYNLIVLFYSPVSHNRTMYILYQIWYIVMFLLYHYS